MSNKTLVVKTKTNEPKTIVRTYFCQDGFFFSLINCKNKITIGIEAITVQCGSTCPLRLVKAKENQETYTYKIMAFFLKILVFILKSKITKGIKINGLKNHQTDSVNIQYLILNFSERSTK